LIVVAAIVMVIETNVAVEEWVREWFGPLHTAPRTTNLTMA
jgi:hypothetical protein